MTKAKKKTKGEKQIVRRLPCKLTDEELLRHAKTQAQLQGEISSLQQSKSSAMAQFKSDIDKRTAELGGLAAKITSGIEYREVECTMSVDMAAGKVQVVRDDTCEVVESRNLSEQERQLGLFGDGGLE